MYRADTIVACATAPGRAAIAVVRMSGPEAFSIADRILVPSRARSARPWQLARNTAVDPSTGEALDDVLAVRMPAPRTYTGEDVVEIHCHGSPLVVERILAASTRSGARQAERGEFTRRAVLNGRMDLVQAESVADLIDARVAGGARAAWAQLQGALSQRLGELRERLVAVLADIEANVDFSDDELPAEDDGARTARLCAVDGEIQRLLDGFEAARRCTAASMPRSRSSWPTASAFCRKSISSSGKSSVASTSRRNCTMLSTSACTSDEKAPASERPAERAAASVLASIRSATASAWARSSLSFR